MIATVVLAIFGKGKPRIYVLGWTATILVGITLIFMLEMD